MSAPAKVLELVERFERNRADYKSGGYKEDQLRIEFINPFMEALGWDVANAAGYAEGYKDVIHEDAIKIGGATKAPDYCFRIGGARKFFLEAKKPSVDVKGEPAAAYQLRRYAWSAKLPVSILTDFEEFAVYDCRVKPSPRDKASVARILYFTDTEYAAKWDELAAVFGHEAVLKGSFDKFAGGGRGRKGTAEVDDAFLEEIESWRAELAKNIAVRNPRLSVRDLNFAVGRTIDRLIFLRIAEDRGIESYGALMSLLNGERVYKRLLEIYDRADERYNSGLFHFRDEPGQKEPPDEVTTALKLDDEALQRIVRRLYYPESPYEFSVLPADILGQVYEQFLGKVIRLTDGHHAKVEDKPEVKKAGGVYYTPTYIVDYIVRNTVGRLLEGKTPKQVAGDKRRPPLRVLDPACGSGSFLIGAYQYLLDWYRDQYVKEGPESHRDKIYDVGGRRQAVGGNSPTANGTSSASAYSLPPTAYSSWRLTTAERKRILLAHIHGVDIDPQAVEVTKLSLLLKVLEGESGETLQRQLAMFHERALPDLAANIKCGNSLIGPDYFTESLLPDKEDMLRVNPFDWEAEFPGVFLRRGVRKVSREIGQRVAESEADDKGGFDCVIGNPPWGQKSVQHDEPTVKYIRQTYPSVRGIYDLFRPFVEQGIKLTATGGRFGMVLPDIVLLKDYPDTRLLLLRSLALTNIDWWGMAFASAVIDAVTMLGIKEPPEAGHVVSCSIHEEEADVERGIPQDDFLHNPRYVINLHLTSETRRLLEEIGTCFRLEDYFEVHEGVHSGNIRNELFVDKALDGSCRELLFGRDEIAPYRLDWHGKYIRKGAVPKARTAKRYANVGRPEWYSQPKILVRRTGDYVLAAVDSACRYASNNFFVVFPKRDCSLDLDGLCALLNSRFMTWYFRTIEPRKGRVFAEIKIKHLNAFPLPRAIGEAGGCDALNALGRQRIAANSGKAAGKSSRDQEIRLRLTRDLDRQIDDCVLSMIGPEEELRRHVLTEGKGD